MPITASVFRVGIRARALVAISDPAERPIIPSKLLKELFGLTRAEATLASALACGQSVSDYAEAARISEETARSHVKKILAKTGTNRQSELVALISSGPLGVFRHEEK
jgi:DNA-binding CsgD family transcriptional regulator